ncbi:MAG: AtpZ/AtpI family protein [Acidimicrobiales bacterium]|nr:AtpZ/AtpI family protein [Acidimicrobiales bacterium]
MARNAQRELQEALWRSSGGYDLVLGPVILSLGGLWLDRRLETTPLFTIGLLLFGAVGAAAKVYYEWKRGMEAAAIERDRMLAEAAALRAQARAAKDTARAADREVAS